MSLTCIRNFLPYLNEIGFSFSFFQRDNIFFRFFFQTSLIFITLFRLFSSFYRLFGSGWHAWTTYEPYCKEITSSLTDDCFANSEPHKLQNITKKLVAPTLASFNQFKYSTPAPFTTVPPTKKFLSATAQFVNYYTTSTTERPSFVFTTKSPTIPSKFATQSTTPSSVNIKRTNQHTYAVLRNNFFTTSTTTPKPSFPLIASVGVSNKNFNQLPTPAPQTFFMTKTTTQKPPITKSTSKSTSSSKFNLFDLYLGRLTTKAPERYTFPTQAPRSKNSITFGNQYIARPTQATSPIAAPSISVNSYRLPDNKIQSTTTKPTSKAFQTFFHSQTTNVAQAPRILNATISTTPKPRVWRYSFSGVKSSTL